LFKGKNKFEVQKIMMSEEYWNRLKEHLLSVRFEKGEGTEGKKGT
jgi:hypothetical protein